MGYRHLYMDVWTWDELERCRKGVFRDRDPDEAKARFDRYGPAGRLHLHQGAFVLRICQERCCLVTLKWHSLTRSNLPRFLNAILIPRFVLEKVDSDAQSLLIRPSTVQI